MVSQSGNGGGLPSAPPPGSGPSRNNLPSAPEPASSPRPPAPNQDDAPARPPLPINNPAQRPPAQQPPAQQPPAQRPPAQQPPAQQPPAQRPPAQQPPLPSQPGVTAPRNFEPRTPPASSASEYYAQAAAAHDEYSSYASDEDRPEPTKRGKKPEKKKGLFGKKEKAPKGAKSQKKSSQSFAGGRLGVVVARYAVIGFILLFSVIGIVSVVTPEDTTLSDQVTAFKETVTYDGFPLATGRSYATQFTQEYLTSSPESDSLRTTALQKLAPNVNPDLMRLTPPAYQEIVDGPFEFKAPEFSNGNTVTFFMRALVKNDPEQTRMGASWMYLAVPLYADEVGNVTLSALPSFMSAPTSAISLGVDTDSRASDPETADKIRTSLLDYFFPAWAASDEKTLVTLVDPTADEDVYVGLQGAVEFSSITGVKVTTAFPEYGPRLRDAAVDVAWKLPSGAVTRQSYTVWCWQNDAGDWKVLQINPLNPSLVPESVANPSPEPEQQ